MADPSIRTRGPRTGHSRPELLVVGAASRDIDAADARGWRLGGTVSYAALAAARLGICVNALVGADVEAATAHELDVLRDAGVAIAITPLGHGPVFENRQVGYVREQFVEQLSDPIPMSALPPQWSSPTAVLLGPIANELADDWVEAIPADALVALAWQGVLRDLVAGQPVKLRPLAATPLVRRADVLFVSAEDVAAGGQPLEALLRPGQELFVTHGGNGALHIRSAGGTRRATFIPPRPKRTPVDTTGAGDTFLGAYVAARLSAPHLVGKRNDSRLDAIAAAAGSLAVAAPGLSGVPSLRAVCDALLTPRS